MFPTSADDDLGNLVAHYGSGAHQAWKGRGVEDGIGIAILFAYAASHMRREGLRFCVSAADLFAGYAPSGSGYDVARATAIHVAGDRLANPPNLWGVNSLRSFAKIHVTAQAVAKGSEMGSQGKEKRKRSPRDKAAKIGLGIAIGAGVGAALGNMGVGMAIGIALSGVWEVASSRMGRAVASDCS